MGEVVEDHEDFLNLSLSIVSRGWGNDARAKKRIRRENNATAPVDFGPLDGSEGKIFKLLQTREEMLKTEFKPRQALAEDRKGLHLIHLLLVTATAVDENNVAASLDNLTELYQTVSLTGDSVQRVVAYFADGLAARLLTRKSPFYEMIAKKPTAEEEFVAFTDLYKVSPYYQFAHFTANQAILEAFEKEEEQNLHALHVIDFDVSHGFQWPSLIQSLSEKATNNNRISLRITGFGQSAVELRETESRLVSFVNGFRNIVFEFQGLIRGTKLINVRKKKQETIVVNLVFHLNTLNNYTRISETLTMIQSIKPSVVTLVEQEGSRNTRSFLSRFMESLHYFAAMFDSLDDCLPPERGDRLRIEKNHLGKEIKTVLNYEKDIDRGNGCCPKYERMETWKGRMESHGFTAAKMSSKVLIQAKLLLKIRAHYRPIQFEGENVGFRVIEKDNCRALSLGWQDRSLITASAWHCVR